ncbi:GMC family oxidoreductase [Microbacterium marinum]|uniref:GMC family oxidoreductase n=1 Tax=Microbacterium marinum TaxID=421115 RepID=UPI00384B445F
MLQRSCHTLGTCRMSEDPEDGVVDAAGRSHEVDNLWICDNSTFPSALTANPALTQMALSLRTADLMLDVR